MRLRLPILTMTCSGVLLAGAACADTGTEPDSAFVPDAATVGEASGLSVYGLGTLTRAVPRSCPAPGTRAFDFWLGNWNVLRDGDVVATDVVTSDLDGCVIMEDFINSGGAEARSMSVYEAATGQWHQVYQDNLLGNYRIDGMAAPERMEMSSVQQVYHFGLGAIVTRTATSTWTDLGDGSVHQTIVGSFDDQPQQVLFDGLYDPVETLDRADPAVFPFCQQVLDGFRELDFWLGSWTAVASPGTEAGVAEVRADLNGCLLQQDFVGKNGYRSRSFLFWDFAEDRWFRTLADNSGGYVQLSGNLDGDRMVLTGTDQGPDGRSFQVRNILSPESSGVTETWEVSKDGGTTWESALTLGYVPR